MEAGDRVRARFQPADRTTLKPEMVMLIGHTAEFDAGWLVDAGPYKGQWAMVSEFLRPAIWAPLCDLEVL